MELSENAVDLLKGNIRRAEQSIPVQVLFGDAEMALCYLIDKERCDASQGNASVAMTFSFMLALPTYADPAVDGNNFSVMTGEQKAAIREILTMLSSQFDLVFTEVTDSGSSYGQLRFGNNAQGKYGRLCILSRYIVGR